MLSKEDETAKCQEEITCAIEIALGMSSRPLGPALRA